MLVHFFQDSLTGATQKWYMSLDCARIRTFNDLANAFIHQYSYNSDMVPDREQLRAMTQGDKEAFMEYAQRWRGFAAQIVPPLEDKELTRIFLKTLSPFYYERMIATAPSNFAEMVGMGMRLEERVREGRLRKESTPARNAKRFGNNYPKKKEQEIDMVAHGGYQPGYPTYPYVANISPSTPAPQNPYYQPQMPQRPPPYYPPLYQLPYPQNQQFPQYPYYPQNPQQFPQQPYRPQENQQ